MMEGETSQNTVTGGIFDGEPEINFSEPTEGTETETQSADAQKQPEPEANEQGKDGDVSAFLTVRYNKADKVLTRDEAVAYAQKGLNYDHVSDELKSYREGPIGRAMKAYADEAGMSVEQYAELMISNHEAATQKAAVEKLREQYPEAPDELLDKLVKAQRAGEQEKTRSAEETKRQKAWADALAEYPEIKPESIPQDVHDAVASGSTPLEAMRLHELTELRTKVAELTAAQETKEKQNDNRARSIGSAAGVNSGGDAEDEFLAGMASRVRS